MKRFAAFETSALTARASRLARTEEDLRARIEARASEVTGQGGWIRTDPLHQHLTGILTTVGKALDDTKEELGRRGDAVESAHEEKMFAVEA
jgi:hypothetical protein